MSSGTNTLRYNCAICSKPIDPAYIPKNCIIYSILCPECEAKQDALGTRVIIEFTGTYEVSLVEKYSRAFRYEMGKVYGGVTLAIVTNRENLERDFNLLKQKVVEEQELILLNEQRRFANAKLTYAYDIRLDKFYPEEEEK